MNVVDHIEVELKVELGSATMPIHHLLRMGRGAVIELDTTERDPMRIYANNSLIGYGEVRIDEGHIVVEVIEKTAKARHLRT